MSAMILPQTCSTSLTHRQAVLSRALPVTAQRCSPRCAVPRLSVSCKARRTDKQQKEQETATSQSKLPSLSLAALLAAGIVFGGAGFPEDALAARSGGRVGGSSGFRSAPRSAPAPRAQAPRQQNNYYNYSAPPLTGGYNRFGYGGGFGGFGGINVFPSFGVPIFAGSGFFNLILIAIVFSTVTGIVRSLLGGRRRDDFDDFD